MKGILVAGMTMVAMFAADGATAGKVNIPKEGSYAFDFCPIGRGKTFSSGEKFFVMNYDLDAIVRSTPSGGAFDRMGARCYGIYANINDRQREAGICEITDLDGDKWFMDYHGNADGKGGTYTAAYGTGKYDGAVIQGEYRLDNNWGSPSKEVSFLGCNPNKGTYQLR